MCKYLQIVRYFVTLVLGCVNNTQNMTLDKLVSVVEHGE